jgi:hypothetical protein
MHHFNLSRDYTIRLPNEAIADAMVKTSATGIDNEATVK